MSVSVRTRLFAFLRIQVGCVALLLADQICGQSSFKNDKVFMPSSADLPSSVLKIFLIVMTGKTVIPFSTSYMDHVTILNVDK